MSLGVAGGFSPPPFLQTRLGAAALLAFCLLLLCALMLAPLFLIRDYLVPGGRLLGGPLYGGWLVMGPPGVFLAALLLLLNWLRRKGVPPERRVAYAAAQFGFLKYPLWIAAAGAAGVYLFGLTAYWSANSEGVTVHRGLLEPAMIYPWSEVVERRLACSHGRHGLNVSFTVRFGDGFALDLAATQQRAARKQFASLAVLTRTGATLSTPRDLAACPPAMVGLLSRY